MSVCLPTYPPAHLPTYLPTYPPTHLPTYLRVSARNVLANVRHACLYDCSVSAIGKKFKVCSDGEVWSRGSVLCRCVWQGCRSSSREDVFTFNLLYKDIVTNSHVLFHNGSLLHSMFNTHLLITVHNSSRILTQVQLLPVLEHKSQITQPASTRPICLRFRTQLTLCF
jgi:hypothetical protein